jgi:hypothetical protein
VTPGPASSSHPLGGDARPSVGALLAELARAPGRLCLTVGDQAMSRQLLQRLASEQAAVAVSIGRLLTESEARPRFDHLEDLIGDASFLIDLDILFWPDVRSNPLQLLRSLSRKTPRFVQWPGALVGKRLTYSEPGRRDFFDATIDDAVIMRPQRVQFPDEIPYEVERIPA